MVLAIGDTVAPFSLPTDDGGTFSEADLHGKRTVLYFYPKDDTPGCTKQAQAFRDMIDGFQAAGVAVVGVSTDGIASHRKFKSKHGLNFPLLADEGRTSPRRSASGSKRACTARSTWGWSGPRS